MLVASRFLVALVTVTAALSVPVLKRGSVQTHQYRPVVVMCSGRLLGILDARELLPHGECRELFLPVKNI